MFEIGEEHALRSDNYAIRSCRIRERSLWRHAFCPRPGSQNNSVWSFFQKTVDKTVEFHDIVCGWCSHGQNSGISRIRPLFFGKISTRNYSGKRVMDKTQFVAMPFHELSGQDCHRCPDEAWKNCVNHRTFRNFHQDNSKPIATTIANCRLVRANFVI